MIQDYKVIYGEKDKIYTVQTEVKKSKFITYMKTVENEEEATAFINEIKKKHYDASHNCSAFILGTKKEIVRSSDDGEPQGTAGRPMLDMLMGSNLVNVIAVVTRYFGGTELGRGGLTRAYSGAVQAGIEQENSEYTDVIMITLIIPIKEMEEFEKKITEISAGKSRVEVVEEVEEVYFPKVE